VIDDEVLFLPVAELGPQIRARRLSPVELTEAFLARIRRLAPGLNAFETVTADLSRAQARAAEDEVNHGRYRGPLHGIPYGAKDLFATAGIRTTWGAAPCRDQVFHHDATVVRRLREAGAVLLGKLAMVEFAGGLGYRFANASVSGPGRNPWNRERWAGGSSSGSGAAVAAGLVSFALGTETWGSILCPAAFCGVTGLRPTYGRVSRAGAMVCAWTYDKVGPLARSAEDCRIILKAIAGPDPDDPSASTRPVPLDRVPRPPSRLRAALVQPDWSKHGEPEARAAFDRAVAELRAAGLGIEDAALPALPASEVAGVIITAEALSTFERFYRDGSVWRLSDAYAPHQPEINRGLTGADLVKAWRIRRVLQERMADFFAEYDVILSPNFLSVAPRITDDLIRALPYPDPLGAIGNTCGLPSIALPCGFGKGRMPLGFQLVGSPWDEATVLALGQLYQRRTSHHRERPPLD